jgi:hypothetical protein
MLLMAAVVVLFSFLLVMRADGRLAFRCLPNWPLPPTCLSQSLFGVKCPGCGLTRSFVCLAGGHWSQSLDMHRLGWLLALAVLFQFPYRLVALLCGRDRPLGRRIPWLFSASLIVLLIGTWVVEMIHGCPG